MFFRETLACLLAHWNNKSVHANRNEHGRLTGLFCASLPLLVTFGQKSLTCLSFAAARGVRNSWNGLCSYGKLSKESKVAVNHRGNATIRRHCGCTLIRLVGSLYGTEREEGAVLSALKGFWKTLQKLKKRKLIRCYPFACAGKPRGRWEIGIREAED